MRIKIEHVRIEEDERCDFCGQLDYWEAVVRPPGTSITSCIDCLPEEYEITYDVQIEINILELATNIEVALRDVEGWKETMALMQEELKALRDVQRSTPLGRLRVCK